MVSRTRAWLLAATVVAVLGTGSPASAAGPPAVTSLAGGRLVVSAADGTALRRLPYSDSSSLEGGLLARSVFDPAAGTDTLYGHDPVTGARRFVLTDARSPLVLGRGRAVAFKADHFGRRDPQVNSVWLRDTATGRVRRLAQFSNGPGLPGIQTGLDAVAPSQLVADAAGRRLAITEGNDVDLFHYDVWLADTASGAVRRMTTGGRSRFPALTASGDRLAVSREGQDFCAVRPYRAADLVVIDTTSGASRTVLRGSCETLYYVTGWADAGHVVATRVTPAADTFRGELVSVTVATGAVRRLSTIADVLAPVSSAELQQVGFARAEVSGAWVLDLRTGAVRRLPGALSNLRGSRAYR